MNRENLFYSSTHANAVALLKERALHEYRDQERQARRDVELISELEGELHRFWRNRAGIRFRKLETPTRAEQILEMWRSSVTRHGASPIEVADPTKRSLEQALHTEQINHYT
jgi:hypothetical protein